MYVKGWWNVLFMYGAYHVVYDLDESGGVAPALFRGRSRKALDFEHFVNLGTED